MVVDLELNAHARYFKFCLNMLPAEAVSQDASRMTVAHLCLVGLATLGRLNDTLSATQRASMVDWIYEQQIPRAGAYAGFRGGSLFGPHSSCTYAPANSANLAATYSALCSLLLLGDSLSRVDKRAITSAMRQLQLESGTFVPHPGTNERDPRFIYCACAISAILDDWSGVDKDAATRYIAECSNYDGGMTQARFQESHGGHLYCCVASLSLMGRLDALPDRQRTLKWALFRQSGGYHGRTNKVPDVCYSFWIGAAIEMLGGHDLVDTGAVAYFIRQCEADIGGLAKWPGYRPDPLHASLGIVGYSFCCPEKFPRMSPELLLPESVLEAHQARQTQT
ncbi:geranylgeranyl transferase type-1 subunit beta [Coemansia sp. RSA 1199]|nr:geranylgeranyl transferase type-1 subunit beta [Coemansia sp. RSA 1199]